jgi:NitT/TauT family transport system substrate-binding protein
MTREIDRRSFVKTAAGTAIAATTLGYAPSVIAQSMKEITFTQSWIPNGGSQWVYVADAIGAFKKRGISAKISRGFGSVVSAQAVGQGKFNFGISSAPAAFLQVVKGLDLAHLACCSYSSSMGVGYLRSSGIKTPKDLEGRKMGSVVTSGEFPFLPLFAQKAGFDFGKVETVQVDNKIRTGVLLQKKVDSISCFASSVAPDVKAKGYDVGWFLYDNYDMPFYGYMLITQPEMYAKDKGLCEAVTAALMEGIMYTMLNPAEAMEMFIKAVPEAGLTASKKEALKLETGLFALVNNTPEVAAHGMGSISMESYQKMSDMIMTYVAKPGEKAPSLDKMLHTTEMVRDKFKFTPEELAKVDAYAKQYAAVLS